MTAHSPLGASSAYRWMRCPGSIRLSKGMPKQDSMYAKEGTAAHVLAENCLLQCKKAADCLDEIIAVDGTNFTVDTEMAEAVQVHLDAINTIRKAGDVMAVEQRFDLGHFYPGMFGTNDCSLYRPTTGELSIFDYKHGRGVPVEAENNPQLLYYGLGAATATPGRKLTTVTLVVVQPRCNHPEGPVRSWSLDAVDLLDWSADLVAAAEDTEKTNAPLQAGYHCKFCPAAPKCPALRDQVMQTACADFSADLVFPEPETFAAADLARVLSEADLLETWIHRVRDYAYFEADSGRAISGFKLVAKRGKRIWRDKALSLDFLRGYGMEDADIYQPPKVKSPTQIEKVIGRKNMPDLAHLVVKYSSGTVLVEEADSRPALSGSAEQDFAPSES